MPRYEGGTAIDPAAWEAARRAAMQPGRSLIEEVSEEPEQPVAVDGTPEVPQEAAAGEGYAVVWEEPPARRRGRSDESLGVWGRRLEVLKERPGEWARIWGPVNLSAASGMATALKGGKRHGVDPTLFEFMTRTTTEDGEKKGVVYGRFLGE